MINMHDEIDTALGEVVEKLREKYKMLPRSEFSGQVTGILIATAIKLAKRDGCPRAVLEHATAVKISEAYGP